MKHSDKTDRKSNAFLKKVSYMCIDKSDTLEEKV